MTNSNINNKKSNNKCKIKIDNYEKQILNITEGLIKAYGDSSNTTKERLLKLKGITEYYKKMLENLSSDDCKVKKEFIPNAELIISLSKTVTTLLNFIDALMPKAKSSTNKNPEFEEFKKEQEKKLDKIRRDFILQLFTKKQ